METLKKHALFLLLLSFLLNGTPPAVAAPQDDQTSESMVAKLPEAKDGRPFLDSVLQKLKTIQDYNFESAVTKFAKGKPKTETGKFYFKNPNLVRFEALKAGHLSGAVVVRQPDGKVKARSGGMLSGIVVSLSPTSKLLQTPNGYNILQSDLGSLLEGVEKLSANMKCMVNNTPSPFPGHGRTYIVEVMKDPNSVVQRVVLDAENKLPIEWFLFDGDKLDSMVHFQKLVINSGAPDALFALTGTFRGGGDKEPAGIAVAESIQDSMSNIGETSRIESSILNEASAALKQMKLESEFLESEDSIMQMQVDNNATSDTSKVRRDLLVRTTTIEAISDSLRTLEHGIQNLDTQDKVTHIASADQSANNSDAIPAGESALADQWRQQLRAIKNSIGALYDILDSRNPDTQRVAAEARKIRVCSAALETIAKKLSERI